jgi:hypothetical protein
VNTKASTRRFLFQNRQAAAAVDPAPKPTPVPSFAPVFARFAAEFDRISASLDEIRAGLDRVAAVLEQMPLDLQPAADLPGSIAKPSRKRRMAAVPVAAEPEAVQEMLGLVFS